MKPLSLCFLIIVVVAPMECWGETRIIGVHVSKTEDSKTGVSIYSDVKSENQRNISIQDAARILKQAQGWGSVVYVGVVVEGRTLTDYLPLLEEISKNHWLELAFVETTSSELIQQHIKRRIQRTRSVAQ